MEPRTKQQMQHKREARKRGLAPRSSSAKTLEEHSRIRLSKRGHNDMGTGPSTTNQKKAGTANKRTKTKGVKTGNRSGNSGAAVRTRSKKRSAATRRTAAAKKTKPRGQESLGKKNISCGSEDLTSVKHQLASTQEALQKVLQCYGLEFFRGSLGERSRDTSKGTAETLVQRELLTLKRLLYLISGGQVPLPVPPDFFYVLTKQYLDGTWTDICAAAAKAATGALPDETKTSAAAGRTAISVETVHEIPPAAQRKASRSSAAAVEKVGSTSATTAHRLPPPRDVAAGSFGTPQIEEVEQCIRVEIEGEEPMEWRDVYRLPEEGPPVLVSSSANERACAASISGETLKRETVEMPHDEKGDEEQLASPHFPVRPAEQKEVSNRSDVVGQQEEQLEQRRDVVFTVQPQHAAARTSKKGRGSSQGSGTSTEGEEETGSRASTRGVQSLRERRVTLPAKLPSPPEVFRLREVRRKSELEDMAGTRGRLSPVGQSGSSSWFAAPARERPKLEKAANSTSTGRMYFGGRHSVGSAAAQGQSGTLASSRVRSISSFSSRNGILTGRQGLGGSNRSSSRAASTQDRNSERSVCSRTAAVASLFPPACSSTAGETEGTLPLPAAAPGGSRQTDESSSDRLSLSGEQSDSNYFIPAPGRRRESGAQGSSVDVSAAAAVPLVAGTAASRVPFQQRGQQQQQKTKTPLFVGGSASPLGRPSMKAGGAPELAAVRAALAAATAAAAGADDTRTAYIFDIPPYTGGSPPQSALYYTSPQLPASPPPSPVFPVFPTAAAAAAPGRSSISAGKAGLGGRVFIPPSAAYPYGALVPESFVFPPPPPSPASPVFGSWETHDETASVPRLLAGASVASSQSEGNFLLGAERQQQDDGLTAAARAAARAATTTHKATMQEKMNREEEGDGGKEIWSSTGSERQRKKQEKPSKDRGGLQAGLPRFTADGRCTVPSHEGGKSRKQKDEQKPGHPKEAPASIPHVLHDGRTPHSGSVAPAEDQEEDGKAQMTGESVTAGDSSNDGYDEAAAAAALGCRVYRYSARPGNVSYDVFKTAAVQAVLLAHAQEMFVPMFWNEDGAPISWPQVTISPPSFAGARHSQISEEQQGEGRQRQKPQEVQSVAATKGEETPTVFVAAVPCSRHEGTTQQIGSMLQQTPKHQWVDPLRFSPPEGRQCQWWGRMDKSGFSVESPVVSCRMAYPAAESAVGSHEEDWKDVQFHTDHGSAKNLNMSGAATAAAVPTVVSHAPKVIRVAASAPLSAPRSTVSEDVSVTPWCSFKHALLSPYSRLPRAHVLTSACCAAAPSRPSSAKSRSAGRISARKSQEQQHHQQHRWPDIQTTTVGRAAADSRRSDSITDAYRMRGAPPDVVGVGQKAAGGDARAGRAGTWYTSAFGLDKMSNAATGTTRTFNWSSQRSSKPSPASPRQQKAPAEAECRMSERTEPPQESHTEQSPTCAAALERLDSILREASNLDARLQLVDGKVEKLLKARRRSKGPGC